MKQVNRFQNIKRFLFHCLCPTRCACCGKVIYQDEELCVSCQEKVLEIKGLLCGKCHSPLHLCQCSRGKVTSIPCVSAFPYTPPVQEGVLTLKKSIVHGIPYFAKAMAKEIGEQYKNVSFHGIVYVPITDDKKKTRGYNQCELLANALGKELNLPVFHDGLIRIFDTTDLHKSDTANRRGCVFGVFDANPRVVENKTLLLIDDVVTTGATLNECAKMLYLADANAVYGATIATRHLQLIK